MVCFSGDGIGSGGVDRPFPNDLNLYVGVALVRHSKPRDGTNTGLMLNHTALVDTGNL